jgi:outer membrane protein assembly factor BamB
MPPLSRYLLALSLATAISSTSAAGESEWTQFRGPTGQGTSAAVNVPIEWDAASMKNVAWRVELPGSGWSSPVISKGRVYLTAAMTGDSATATAGASGAVTLHVLCCDAQDGRTLWDTEVFQPSAEKVAAVHRKNSLASPTPLLAGDRLFVHFGHMGTAALDLAGKVLWRQTELQYAPVHGPGGSPVLVGDELIFNCDGASNPFVVGLDAKSGAVRWKTPRNSPAQKQFSFSTPLVIDVGEGPQVISPASGFVAAYHPGDGQEIWRVSYGEGYSLVPRPVFAHGTIYLSSGFDRPVMYAINPEGATGDATQTNVVWTEPKSGPTTPSPLVLGDEIYYVSDAGVATCADAMTGKVHWRERLAGGFSASPVAAERRVYFQNETGVGYVLKGGKTFEVLAKNDIGDRTLASYGVVDGALFLRSEKALWKIGR